MKRKNHSPRRRFRPGQFVAPASYLRADNISPPVRGAILHPTDYSEASQQAFELACCIARDRGSRLIVMHVAEPVHASSLSMAPLPSLPKGYRGAWESRLRLIQPRDPAVRVEHRLEEGDVVAAILRVAHEEQSDLIVLSGREQTWLARLLTPSIAEQVERKAPCPVLRLHAQQAGNAVATTGSDSRARGGIRPRAILYPTDLSQPARLSFELACSLAREADSQLVVAHIAPVPDLHRKSGYRDEMEAALSRMVASAPTVRARWVLLADDPAAEILWMAREGWCDLIVMDTRRRTGLQRLFGRSVTALVRRKSPCPVVTISVPPDRPAALRAQPALARPRPASDSDSDGGNHDCSANYPAPDGFLALRR